MFTIIILILIIVSSPVHRGSDTTNTFLASPSVNPVSPAISSMSSNSTKPLTTQLTSTSLSVAPPRVSHGSITFADDVGKSLTETNGKTRNSADKRTPPETMHTCQHQCPEGGQDDNKSKCTNNSTQSQKVSSSDVATSPISPHYFVNSKFDPESFDTCSCSRQKKPNKPAIKPYKDIGNSDDNHSHESNSTLRTQNDEIENKELQKYSRHVDRLDSTQSGLTSSTKRKNGIVDTQMNSNLKRDSGVQSKHLENHRNYKESQSVFAPFSYVSEKARLIDSEVNATSDLDSSEGNCDECDSHERHQPLNSSNTLKNHHIPNHDSPHMPNSSANVALSDGGHPLADCYGGGSCSEDCYSYSGSASGCSCMGSCDQQSQLMTEDGDSIITGATVGSSLAANNDGFVSGFPTTVNNPGECMATSLIDPSMLSNTSLNRRMNGSALQQNHLFQFEHDQIDQNLDLSIILRPQKGHHHHHTLPRSHNNSSNTKTAKSMETIPLEMCQDIPDVLI